MTSIRRLGHVAACAAVIASGAGVMTSAAPQTSPTAAFARAANGAAAAESGRRTITAGSAGSFGLVNAVAVCGDVAYLADQFRVYEASLETGTVTRIIGDASPERNPGTISSGFAVDCEGDRIYRASYLGGVAVFDRRDGHELRRIDKPPLFSIARGLVLHSPGRLLSSGLWWPSDEARRRNDFAFLYVRPRFGWLVDTATGQFETLAIPLALTCPDPKIAAYCQEVAVDVRPAGDRTLSVYAQATGTAVALQQRGQPTITVPITSPRFVRSAAPLADLANATAWLTSNSAVSAVFASDEGLSVVHRLLTPSAQSPPVRAPQFTVYANFYDRSGTPLVADVRLPDLAVGRDQTSMFVVDYGPGGRQEGTTQVTLVSIPLDAARHAR